VRSPTPNAASSRCRRSNSEAFYFTTGGLGWAAIATGSAGGGGAAMATGATANGPGGTNWLETICCCIKVRCKIHFTELLTPI
jgi:hypothetical protein